jgi:hypothetical protein
MLFRMLDASTEVTSRVPITVEDIIAEAPSLPLRDAAYTIWREKAHFERRSR